MARKLSAKAVKNIKANQPGVPSVAETLARIEARVRELESRGRDDEAMVARADEQHRYRQVRDDATMDAAVKQLSEAFRVAVEAGIDVVSHAEYWRAGVNSARLSRRIDAIARKLGV